MPKAGSRPRSADPTLRPAKTDSRRRTTPPAGRIRQKNRELGLLSEIERDPDATQAGLAVKLGVAVGTINWHLKRLIAKGYIKVKRAERRKLRYIITPSGIGLRARLTVTYIETSMALYRQVRKQARQALSQVRQRGYQQVRIEGDGDLADVCRLTCLEMGVRVESTVGDGSAAVLQIDGRKVRFVDLGTPEGR